MAIPSPPVTRQQMQALLERGLRAVVFQKYRERTGEWQPIYNIDGSVKATETDAVMAGLYGMSVFGEGDTPTFDSMTQAYTKVYTHLQWGVGYKITRIAMEDDLYGWTDKLGSELARAARYTEDLQAMSPFNNPTATQYTAGGSNFPLVSATQYRQDDLTWSNILASGADFSVEALEAALMQWHGQMVDLRGRKLNIQPKYVLHPVSTQIDVLRVLNSLYRPNSDLNDVNVIRNWNLEPLCSSHLTDDGRWYLIGAPADTTLQWWNRRNFTLDRETDSTGTQNEIYVASRRFSLGITAPHGIFGSL